MADYYQQQLEDALIAYQLQEIDRATDLFTQLATRGDVPQKLQQEAMIYMAGILLRRGDDSSIQMADQYFREVILDDPTYQIDRFVHPPEVTARFDQNRSLLKSQIERLARPPWVFRRLVPAAYALEYEAPKYNGLLLGVEVPFAAASIGGFTWLWVNSAAGNFQETQRDQIERLRYGQWAVSGVGAALWLTRLIRTQQHWNRNFRSYSELRLDEEGQPEWVVVGVKGRF